MDGRLKQFFLLAGMMIGVALLAQPAQQGWGQTTTPLADLGDAPDSSNNFGVAMQAYPGVTAHFPTVFSGDAPHGPRHEFAARRYFLGAAVSAEVEADSDVDTDPDGANNIDPLADRADQDGADDGLLPPRRLDHCQTTSLQVTVTVNGVGSESVDAYLNLWADWDRSGAWSNAPDLLCPDESAPVAEWIVSNHLITLPGDGVHTIQTPPFRVWNPQPRQEMWLRVTLSDAPGGAEDGSGPATGYQYGETEDYLLPPQLTEIALPLVVGGGGAPPPPEDGHHEDPEFEPEVLVSWPQVPEGEEVAVVDPEDLILRVENNAGETRILDVRLTFMAGGRKHHRSLDPMPVVQPGVTYEIAVGRHMTDVIVYPPSSGVAVGEVFNLSADGAVASVTPVEPISFHGHESAAGHIVIYGEEALSKQVSDLEFIHAPAMSSRLTALMPAEEDLSTLDQIAHYTSADPVLHEPAVDPDSQELVDLPPPPHSPAPLNHNQYILCPEWYTAPVDNGFGEDYGLNDDGWRARGARVRVWQSGTKLFDGWLNRYGCTAVYSASNAGLLIWFTGESRLESGSGYINIRYISNNSTALRSTSAWIDNPQNGAVYRPEVHYRDAVGMLSYAAQERFNGGVSGQWFYLRKAGCNNDPDKGSCSTGLNGEHIIYSSPGQWRRKFVVIHEYGHKILSMASSYKNDCSYGGSGHSMKSIEYASCAAMEGWAHFVAADVWNEGHSGQNPGAAFVYWDSSSTVYDVEIGGDQQYCYSQFLSAWKALCDWVGTELDWMRHWWDFHTNNLPNDPGFRPAHSWMFDLVDDVSWQTGMWKASEAFENELSGGMRTRWRNYGCWNGIKFGGC